MQNQNERTGEYRKLLDGENLAVIVDSWREPECMGGGLTLVFQALTGEINVRRVKKSLPIVSENSEEGRKARGELARICRAVGVHEPRGSKDLHDKQLYIGLRDGLIVGYAPVDRERSIREANRSRCRVCEPSSNLI